MKRVVVVGEQPGPNSPSLPESDSGRHLAELAGVKPEDLWRAVEHVNLFDEYADAWDAEAARNRGAALLEICRGEGRHLISLGSRVAAALRLEPPRIYAWFKTPDGIRAACAVHPSRKNRLWNRTANVRAAQRFWSVVAAREIRRLTRPIPVRRNKEGERPIAEMEWIRDQLEREYVRASGSGADAVHHVMELHRLACASKAEVEWAGATFQPVKPISRTQCYNLLNDVRRRWCDAAASRVEERRVSFLEVATSMITEARQAGAWSAAAKMLEVVGEVEGVLGRPDERAAAAQVQVNIDARRDDLERLPDDELEAKVRAELGLPAGRVVVDADVA